MAGDKRKSGWEALPNHSAKKLRAAAANGEWGSQSTAVGTSTTISSDATGNVSVSISTQTAPSAYAPMEDVHIDVPAGGLGNDGQGEDSDQEDEVDDEGGQVADDLPGGKALDNDKEEPKKPSTSRSPIWAWIEQRPALLRELISLDGRHQAIDLAHLNLCRNPACDDTRSRRRFYRCMSGCMRCDWYCRQCLLEKHADLPLHRVETWIDGHWEKVSLRNLGLAVHFGHPDGARCPQPQSTVGNFVVIHTNGVHEVKAVFCGCTHTFVPPRTQLVRDRWWPATVDNPKTAATFEALDTLDALAAFGKTNAYEFWNTVCLLTDATGIHRLPDRTKEVARMAHEWRHILMCKRAGRGHDRFGGIEDTAPGDLAVLCPACPHEDLNTDIADEVRGISEEIADALPHFGTVLAAMDCNFRTKNKENRSTLETSPALGDGMAFMVPRVPYEEFTNASDHQAEMSSCSRFGAMILANLKEGKGLRTMGIGACFCSRHGLFWPNTVGTLVKGERYCTMDFILAALVRRIRTSSLHLSYDIICQYSRNLALRMSQVKAGTFIHVGAQKLLHELQTSFAVPKFHNPGHKPQCQQWFNLSYQLYTGQTDGEASERGWAGLNPAASSVKEMGPGTMRDTIDFFCNFWNWRKLITMGPFLLGKLEIALEEAEDHCGIYTALRGALAKESQETVEGWIGEAVVWEQRDTGDEDAGDVVKNPYKPLTKPVSLHKARLESAKLMSAAIEKLGNASTSTGDSALTGSEARSAALTNFILRAFKIELMRLRAAARKKHNTILQRAEKQEQANDVARQVADFRSDQKWIQPLVYVGLKELEGERADGGGPEEAEDVSDIEDEDEDAVEVKGGVDTVAGRYGYDKEGLPGIGNAAGDGLYLPSELPKELALQQSKELLHGELAMRWSGMSDNLILVRQYSRIKGTVNAFKKAEVRGQKRNTRTRRKQAAIEANLTTVKESYRLHRARFSRIVALLDEDERNKLVPVNWEDTFRVLEDSDCVALGHRLLMRIEDEQVKRVRRIVAASQGKRAGASGEGGHKVPWIWYTVVEGGDMELNDDLRVEFLKCRARAMRWTEEVYALCIEMVRVPTFLANKAKWWMRRAELDMRGLSRAEKDGTRAYARKQAAMYERQAETLKTRCAGILARGAKFARKHGLDGLAR